MSETVYRKNVNFIKKKKRKKEESHDENMAKK